MSETLSHEDFASRLQDLSERIEAAKAGRQAGAELDAQLSTKHMRELERRYGALHEQFKGTDKHGWEQFKVSLSNSLTELVEEFGHLFTDADEKFRHQKE